MTNKWERGAKRRFPSGMTNKWNDNKGSDNKGSDNKKWRLL